MKHDSDFDLISSTVDCLTVLIERAEYRDDRERVTRLKRAREDVLTVAIGRARRAWWQRVRVAFLGTGG